MYVKMQLEKDTLLTAACYLHSSANIHTRLSRWVIELDRGQSYWHYGREIWTSASNAIPGSNMKRNSCSSVCIRIGLHHALRPKISASLAWGDFCLDKSHVKWCDITVTPSPTRSLLSHIIRLHSHLCVAWTRKTLTRTWNSSLGSTWDFLPTWDPFLFRYYISKAESPSSPSTHSLRRIHQVPHLQSSYSF